MNNRCHLRIVGVDPKLRRSFVVIWKSRRWEIFRGFHDNSVDCRYLIFIRTNGQKFIFPVHRLILRLRDPVV